MAEYSGANLFSFLSWTRLFSIRVYLSSTATSLTVLAMCVPAARLMLGLSPGRWLRSSQWRCWRRSASVRGIDGSGTTSAECVLGPDRTIAARRQSMIGRQAASAAASKIAPQRRCQAYTRERSSPNNNSTYGSGTYTVLLQSNISPPASPAPYGPRRVTLGSPERDVSIAAEIGK